MYVLKPVMAIFLFYCFYSSESLMTESKVIGPKAHGYDCNSENFLNFWEPICFPDFGTMHTFARKPVCNWQAV